MRLIRELMQAEMVIKRLAKPLTLELALTPKTEKVSIGSTLDFKS
jgi:hypothetical protein